ncbi:PP2C family protein-serine/threonine phosphatase [Mycoplasmopsis cynos]|uniref:Protein phosphatase 2C domain-containing protein n=1 Tax=Mycoplasmopsis cynos TaxID=171284 RepID=A0ABD8AJT7_9BACT|nr:protein phosphatase 2C domain-containing protein [Mycoplasmopsis cynos]WQQ13353.1 protein phosphatase 2C domain-containing protein [Mycoplasmopsis cynos]WQQ13629.1 protein phosphatase 2C domain-containing protein [Mycoplasmopsis cynos]WQQ14400.1 protein phosphatase 2C domain-containing protein [Mycoplasmopsis cynos]WQQ15364.1 protein phosphatase 2C domain-containing protein [Mycoplasmopsis cynos]WQQ16468.1 protein phosphatase 2C domain-containing protein [Mycoplasmopsis cynos]
MIKIDKISEKGNQRTNNEDRVGYFIKNNIYLGILCDGMGGHKNGDHAANIALEILSMDFMNFFTYTNIEDLKSFIFNSIMNIKNEMKKIAIDSPEKKDMGTTLVSFMYNELEKKLIVFYSGDSRCYIYKKNGELLQITRDHNLLNRWIDEGIEQKNIEKNYRVYRYLTSAIGANLETKIDFIVLENNFENPITKILLTSDGIHEFLTNDQIHFILSNKKDTTLQKLNSLVTLSLISESNDNMSAILMEIKNDK